MSAKQERSHLRFSGHDFSLATLPCDFCGGSDFIPFWSKMRYGLNLPTVFCRRCGLCQSHPRPTPDALETFYSKLYNQFHKREVPIEPHGEYVVRSLRHAEPRLRITRRFVDESAPLGVLEIGAGVGQYQVAARQNTRWNVRGIEPGKPQAAFCATLGANVKNVFFDDALDEAPESLDAIVSFHVLEHVESPRAFVRRVNRLLKPGGTFHLEVPNLARPGNRLDEFLQFPHLYNFSSVTLRNYLAAVGGFMPIFSDERPASLTIVSRKVGPASDHSPADGGFESYDVEHFMQRLIMLERVFALARTIPNVSVLGKVRSTLMAV